MARPAPGTVQTPGPAARDVLDVLIEQGHILPTVGQAARALARRSGAPIEHVVVHRNLVTETTLALAQSQFEGLPLADLVAHPPDARLIDRLGPQRAIQLGLAPWRRAGKTVLIAAPSRDVYRRALPELRRRLGTVALAIAPQSQIVTAVSQARKSSLTKRAEHLVPAQQSCRSLRVPHWQTATILLCATVFALVLAVPGLVFAGLTALALITLIASMVLKAAAAIAVLTQKRVTQPRVKDLTLARLPQISILVPLYKEREIAGHLVHRLRQISYPRERLEVLLVTESDDQTTRDTLRRTTLPNWMRVISVPEGSVKTKPRAMNYALDHCRGTIIGVFDAEDAPESDQLLKVAAQFATAPPEVVCLQGALDFYNPTENWLSRCFAMEYAAWFRVMLPGLARLGFAIPLGGTTIFFRKEALLRMRGWDAHNVTEDADLGIRLARYGYKTALLPSTTFEEANNRAWPWVKQRSRWLKGYGITYAVHMRHPLALWRELGAWRFLGFQTLFLGTITQFLLAPILWSYWILLFGLSHPAGDIIPLAGGLSLTAVFLFSELIGMFCVGLGVTRTSHRRLLRWVPTLMAYFPLATLAIYKGFAEFFGRPFYWDKTSHGTSKVAMRRLRRLPGGSILPPRRDAAGS
ncbi:MAG: glycosyltransferase [Pseudomonadota bacterium]